MGEERICFILTSVVDKTLVMPVTQDGSGNGSFLLAFDVKTADEWIPFASSDTSTMTEAEILYTLGGLFAAMQVASKGQWKVRKSQMHRVEARSIHLQEVFGFCQSQEPNVVLVGW